MINDILAVVRGMIIGVLVIGCYASVRAAFEYVDILYPKKNALASIRELLFAIFCLLCIAFIHFW